MSVFETLGTVTPLTGGVPPSVAAVQPSLTEQEQVPLVQPKPESVFTGIGTVTQGPLQAPTPQTNTQGLEQHFTGSFHEASTVAEAVKAAWQGSATGLMARGGKAPEVEIGQNTPWLAKQVGAFAGMGADLPLMIAAGTAGGAAGSELPVVGNVAGAMAGFAVPAAIRSYYMEALKNGEVTTADQAIERVSAIGWETVKGAIEGFALGKVGILMGTRTLVQAGIPSVAAEKMVDGTFAKLAADEGKALVASGIPADLAGKEAATKAMEQLGLNANQIATVGRALNMPMAGLSKLAAEVGTLTTTSAFLEGRMPEPSEFVNTAILLGGFHYGMKGGGKLIDKLQDVYQKTGVRPSELLDDIRQNPNMLLDISDATAEVRQRERQTLVEAIKRDDLIKSATDKAYRGEEPTAEESEAAKLGPIDVSTGSPELQRAIEILKTPEDQRTSAETYFLEAMEKGDYGTSIDKNDIRVLAPTGTVTEAAKIKLDALEEKAATTRAETKSNLTEAQQTALDEAQARHDGAVEMYKRNYANDPLELGKRLKGLGMKLSAEKRAITGELTPREQAAKDKREAGNYLGKEVVVDGQDAKIVANPFGRVKVEFADGTTKTVGKDEVSVKPKESPAEPPAEPHVGLNDKEREEYEFLKANVNNPDALAERYGVGLTDVTARGTLPRQVLQSNAYQTMLAQATEAMKDNPNLPPNYADATARVYYAMYDALARRFTNDGTPMTADDAFKMHQMQITEDGTGTLGQALPSRWPSEKAGRTPSVNDPMLADLETLKTTPEQFSKMVDSVAGESGMRVTGTTPEEKAEQVIKKIVDNLLWLHDKVEEPIRARSKLWYDGAEQIASKWSLKYNISKSQASGILAVLSPQKDWFMNVTMAERVIDILDKQMDHKFDPKMSASAFQFLLKDVSKPEEKRDNTRAYELAKDKTLREVVATGDENAIGVWIRAYDEAHHQGEFAIIHPEGDFGENKTREDKVESSRAWGGFDALGKAASIYIDGSPENINKRLGDEHKVRNFYNNIYNPQDPRFATIDTHAVAAALLTPFGGSDHPVAINFGSGKGSAGSDVTGISGSYPIYLEAYKLAAEARGILPREMQSITWEAVRGLFQDTFKTKQNQAAIKDIWDQVDNGTKTREDALEEILHMADGIKHPDWWNGEEQTQNLSRDKSYVPNAPTWSGRKINFEISQYGSETTKRLQALPTEVQNQIVSDVAWNAARQVFGAIDLIKQAETAAKRAAEGKPAPKKPTSLLDTLKGQFHTQIGGYKDETNPSFSLWMNEYGSTTNVQMLSKVLGYVLHQNEMQITSPDKFKGSEEKGIVGILIPKDMVADDVASLYTELRGAILDKKGKPLIDGHTSDSGLMGIQVKLGTEEALHQQIVDYLGDRYDVVHDSMFVESQQKGKDDYGLARTKKDRRSGSESSLGAYADRIREATDAELDSRISAAERGDTSGNSGGAGSESASGTRLGQGQRGFYEPATNTVGFLKAADPSTAIHEGFHFFFDFMAQMAKREDAPAELKADVLKMLDYLGIKGGLEEWDQLGNSQRGTPEFQKWEQAHEQMAKDGERFLITGEFPQTGLRSVLSKFKDWMVEVYKSITNMGVKLSPEIHDIFQRMIGEDDTTGLPKEYAPLVMKELGDKIVPGFKAEQVALQPFPDEPRIAGDIPLGKYINLNYVNDSVAVKALMDKISEVYTKEIQERRGGTEGVKSWEEANAEAAKFFNDMMNNGNLRDLQTLLSKTSKTSIDVELRVKNLLMKAAVRDTVRTRDILMDKWDKGQEVSIQEQLDYLRSIERASMIQTELLGVRAEVGRALNQMKDRSTGHGEEQFFDPQGAVRLGQPGMDDPAIQKQFNELMDIYRAKYGKDFTVKQLADMHKAQKTLKGNLDFNEAFTQSTTFDKFFEAWRAGLLSGPVTHTANFVGNIANDVMRAPIDYIASWFGRARGAEVGMGEMSRQDAGEAFARLGGMFSGLDEAIKVFAETYKTGGMTGKTESYQPAIQGTKGEIIRIPYKLMGATDAMTQFMYRRGELATMAIRTAIGEGLNPATAEFADRVKYLKENPTQSMNEEAVTQALRMAFNKDLGEGGQKLTAFINAFPMMKIIAPFVRTPLNILEEMLRVSAFAPLMKNWREDFQAGGIRGDRAKAEWTLGMGLMGATAMLAFSGSISGNGPVDQNKKRTMQAAGWQPYSIKIGDTWYEYSRIQPIGTLMGMAADLAETWDHIGKDDQDKIPKMLGVAFANAVTNQTFLQGVTSALNAVADPGRSAPNWAKSFAGSLVPNIIGSPTTMADPVARQVDSMLQAVMAKIPGLRQQLRPKLDYLGEPVPGPERVGFILPSRESHESTDKVRVEAARLQVGTPSDMKKLHLGTGSGKIGDVKLEPEESQAYDSAAGKMTYAVMDKIVHSPGWEKIPDPIKINIFHNTIIAAHKYAAAVTFPDAKRQELLGQIIGKMQMNLNAPGATQ